MSSGWTELFIWSVCFALFSITVCLVGEKLNINGLFQSLSVVTYMSTYDFPKLLEALGVIVLLGSLAVSSIKFLSN